MAVLAEDVLIIHVHKEQILVSENIAGKGNLKVTARYVPKISSNLMSIHYSYILAVSWYVHMDKGLRVGSSWQSICPSGLPLKIIIDMRKSPAAVMLSATITLFVALEVFHTWMVFVPCFSRVLELW